MLFQKEKEVEKGKQVKAKDISSKLMNNFHRFLDLLAVNPIPAGVLENQDTLGGGSI